MVHLPSRYVDVGSLRAQDFFGHHTDDGRHLLLLCARPLRR